MLRPTAVIDPDIFLVLNGGSFSIGEDIALPGDTTAPSGPTTMNSLTLNSSSRLSLGRGGPSTTLTFTDGININGASVLSIFGWTGPGGGGGPGTSGRFMSDQPVPDLGKIWFEHYGLGATQLASGEIVPTGSFLQASPFQDHACLLPSVVIPEPSTWIGGGSIVAFAFLHYARRRKKMQSL